ncbi:MULTISPECIES: cupin domain-containing protein [unclassified Undibacterium]|uniref:cupin domain-containing protein n=1 Tax=unclassified Undibacterium TaxID=2630295 RepID=UPI002AC96A11|nr:MULTISPECIES: cupin domain-containing protein [unclassified Undibacterium]MEB0140257.1 cupin domain-containing protein [Undibacterium sp. CCC2.1]MEB0173288.1 cupin domain-containing protein [Undibacterium sp. CCC1.1]MEB0177089.1 cupin domain-containing protein [Undibacterium sp. CCC3.4]MEB0216396.1 cupin domain-containing protein [Undibacterium sp. 5I2]WPX43005.1 cupin domain-containing protein [Undibacterium sp. CCC3.4]
MKKNLLPLTLLGGITAEQFFQEYWHKKPLLIRQAIPGFVPPLSQEQLFDLTGREDVESRLVSCFNSHWEMQNGPIAALPRKENKDWTLLVQGVNLHERAADDLLRQFRFLPDARLDDLMISYAADGGGVGPHFDSYDVFLLQAQGLRKWQIGAQKDLSLIDGMPLKILKKFTPEQEFILEPGDMLYLPPHYAHDGIAIGECMTCSIGFRAPSFQEIGVAFLQFMSDSIDLPGRYADPELQPSAAPAELDHALIAQISEQIQHIRFTPEDITIFIGEYLSAPKASVFFNAPEKALTPKRFAAAAQKKGLRLALKTTMLYRDEHVFINGESFAVDEHDQVILNRLANQRCLAGTDLLQASDDVMEAFCLWTEDGWLELA